MRILVTGREGQVARSLAERAAKSSGIELVTASRPEFDLADVATIAPVIEAARPDLVVSAAAYTAVDKAEVETELARSINVTGAAAVATIAAALDVPIIHLSTDYVFSGDKQEPYEEPDRTDPTSAYGHTKLDSEGAVALANPRHVVLRTAWIYSPFGSNFVKTMLRLARQQDTVRVVCDQWGNPTSALDLADGILTIAARLVSERHPDLYGVFHLAGSGSTSWYKLAEQVFESSRALGGPSARVERITSAEYPTRATRPRNSRLSCEKLLQTYQWQAPDWRLSCQATVARLLAE